MLTPSIPLRSIKKNIKNNESTTNENITRKVNDSIYNIYRNNYIFQ